MPRLLFIGDIVGKPGRQIVGERVAALRRDLRLDFVVANAENAAHGAGLTASMARELLACGVDALTLGDHVWDQKGFDLDLPDLDRVCRPANLPDSCPGRRVLYLESNGFRLAVFTVLGRQYINLKASCPFRASDDLISDIQKQGGCSATFVEIHAEATSEKIALAWHLDGRVAAVVGTHTHVPTADARVLPKGTAALTDAGMTGPYASVLGREVQPVIDRFLDGRPRRFGVADGDVRLSGTLIEIDGLTGLSTSCELVTIRN